MKYKLIDKNGKPYEPYLQELVKLKDGRYLRRGHFGDHIYTRDEAEALGLLDAPMFMQMIFGAKPDAPKVCEVIL